MMSGFDETPYDEMLSYILPEWRTKFEVASGDYGDAFLELGLRGQYSDMHRKFKKIKRVFWDRMILRREQPEEILMDLMSHCLIAIWLLRNTDEGHEITGHRMKVQEGKPMLTVQEDCKAGDLLTIDFSTGKAVVYRG